MKTRNWLLILALSSLALSPMAAFAATVRLAPSGDSGGATDAARLQAAVETDAPRVEIRLAAGTYYLNRSILLERFRGSIRGAGMDKTRIRLAAEIPVTRSCPFSNAGPSKADPWPFLFSIVDGDATLSDMSMDIMPRVPARVYLSDCDAPGGPKALPALAAFVGVFSSDSNPAQRSTLERLRLVGGEGDFHGHNVVQMTNHEGIIGNPPGSLHDYPAIPVNGRHRIVESVFENSVVGNSVLNMASGARVVFDGNRIRNVREGFEAIDSGCLIVFRNNRLTQVHDLGVLAEDGYFHAKAGLRLNLPTRLVIQDNAFQLQDASAAVSLKDWGSIKADRPLLKASVTRNTFMLANTAFGVLAWGLQRPEISWNHLRGTVARDGIALGTRAKSAHCVLVGNDLGGLSAEGTGIRLGRFSSGCRVAMPEALAGILDETDDPDTPEYDGRNTISVE